MDSKSIKELQSSRMELSQSIRKTQEQLVVDTERLKKLDAVLEGLKDLFPSFFEHAKISIETKSDGASSNSTNDFPWDYKLPFRRRVKDLLISMGRFTKVSELAKIVYEKENFLSGETEEELQKKISAVLTSLKMQPKEGIIKRQIHPGASGWAWGLENWGTDEERAAIEKYQNEQNIAAKQLNYFE